MIETAKSGGYRKTARVYFIHCETRTGHTTVLSCSRPEAESKCKEKYDYIVGSLRELVASQLPASVLLQLVNRDRLRNPLRLVKNRSRIERKAWRIIMANDKKASTEEQDAAKAKAEADRLKKEAEEKKSAKAKEAEEKKAAAEKAKADKIKASEEKKAAAAKAKEDKEKEKEAKKQAAAEAKAAREAARSRINPSEKISLLVPNNPKRAGSSAFDRFALYKDGMTVDEYLKAGGTMADINWDLGHRLISLTPSAQGAAS